MKVASGYIYKSSRDRIVLFGKQEYFKILGDFHRHS